MTLDPFQPELSGQPDKRIRIAETEALAQELAALLIAKSPGADEIRQVLRVGAAYESYKKVLERLVRLLYNRPKSLKFFRNLRDEYLQYESEPLREVWVKAMGYMIENTFFVLMTEKYTGTGARILSEHKVIFPPPPCQASTGDKPIDVIAWLEVDKCGEFIEVKKNLDTQRGDSFESKVQVMYEFALDISRHSEKTSIIGVATLSSSPMAEEIIKSILVENGYMLESENIFSISPNFSIIKSENFSEWFSKRVI